MGIQSDIDAKVEAFLQDLTDLVRRVALEAVEEVFAPLGGSRPAAAPKPRRTVRPARTAALPAPVRAAAPPERAPEQVRAAAPSEPAPARRSLKETRRGRLIIVPSTPAAAPAPAAALAPAGAPARHVEQPLPPVVKIPPKLPRKKKAHPVAAPPVAVEEPTPARDWVVARRPARTRGEPGAEATNASSETAVTAAPEASPARPAATP